MMNLGPTNFPQKPLGFMGEMFGQHHCQWCWIPLSGSVPRKGLASTIANGAGSGVLCLVGVVAVCVYVGVLCLVGCLFIGCAFLFAFWFVCLFPRSIEVGM